MPLTKRSREWGCSGTMLYDRLLKSGEVITGIWNKRVYRVEECLGSGANGEVYLVIHNDVRCALKIGYDAVDFQSEINGLTSLQQHAGGANRFLLDSDNVLIRHKDYPFYVMKYVSGVHPARFLYEHGIEWYPVIGYRILGRLAEIHDRGYIFGDLKSDNILVSGYGTTELIDYGGLTRRGRAVRQYTERFDRGFWRAGSRIADERYDLFAYAVVCLELADISGQRLAQLENDPARSVEHLVQLARQLPASQAAAPVIEGCLRGKYNSAAEAEQAWRRAIYAAAKGAANRGKHSQASPGLTLSLAAVLILMAAVCGTVFYWTFSPGW